MKILLLLLMAFCAIKFPSSLIAQEVISSAGDNFHNENGSISWTLGETLIDTYSSADIILTQGFQQPVLSVSTLIEVPGLDFQFTAFPNPTRAQVFVSTDHDQAENLDYRLYDMLGRLVITNTLEGTQTSIDIENLLPGSYFLQVLERGTPLKVFKIIKQR
ncbi:MAG: T9SS C-terminal target domain-containing protein [Bacteroidetes bacterium]|nr:MAG: T9SS C-terminal target domain-containing protein [Bacteroidota bacterium]